ncbi:MAG: glycosyltransferase [Corynebacteriales bacterium]|nr:glycosyltransferase [Mycobacteriales bacterium]
MPYLSAKNALARGILTFSDAWHTDARTGGIPVANAELCDSLGRLGVPVISRAGNENLQEQFVTVQSGGVYPGLNPQATLMLPNGMPAAKSIFAVIGHARFSSPPALVFQRTKYRKALFIHAIHDDPRRVYGFHEQPELGEDSYRTEKSLCHAADCIFAVGPRLARLGMEYAADAPRPIPVYEYTPGLPNPEPTRYAQPPTDHVNVVMLGRMNDEIKGMTTAAYAARELRKLGYDNLQLTMLGVEASTVGELSGRFSNIAGFPVNVLPHTRDQRMVAEVLHGATIAIFPAYHEDFGLAAWKAIAEGVPALISADSGVADVLTDPSRVPARLGRESVVRLPSGPLRADVLTRKIDATLRELPRHRRRALELRDHMATNFTQVGAAQDFLHFLQDRAGQQIWTHKTPLPARMVHALGRGAAIELDDFVLNDDERQVFFADAYAAAAEGSAPIDEPEAILFVNEPGAGKSSVANYTAERYENLGGSVRDDFDRHVDHHVAFKILSNRQEGTAPDAQVYVASDGLAAMDYVSARAREEQRRVIGEYMGDAAGLMRQISAYKAKGYKVHVVSLGISQDESLVRVHERQMGQREVEGAGRHMPAKMQVDARDAMPGVLDELVAHGEIDSLTLLDHSWGARYVHQRTDAALPDFFGGGEPVAAASPGEALEMLRAEHAEKDEVLAAKNEPPPLLARLVKLSRQMGERFPPELAEIKSRLQEKARTVSTSIVVILPPSTFMTAPGAKPQPGVKRPPSIS